MTSHFAKKAISIHIKPNISRSKCHGTMKFGQSIEHKTKNIFLDKSYTECENGGGEAILRPFSKKSKLGIFLDQ